MCRRARLKISQEKVTIIFELVILDFDPPLFKFVDKLTMEHPVEKARTIKKHSNKIFITNNFLQTNFKIGRDKVKNNKFET